MKGLILTGTLIDMWAQAAALLRTPGLDNHKRAKAFESLSVIVHQHQSENRKESGASTPQPIERWAVLHRDNRPPRQVPITPHSFRRYSKRTQRERLQAYKREAGRAFRGSNDAVHDYAEVFELEPVEDSCRHRTLLGWGPPELMATGWNNTSPNL